jgi:hypothetical protein
LRFIACLIPTLSIFPAGVSPDTLPIGHSWLVIVTWVEG